MAFLQPDPNDWPIDITRATPELRRAVGHLLSQPPELGLTQAVVVVQNGTIIAEGYGPGAGVDTTLISWSMAKSIMQSLLDLLVADGKLTYDQPAPIAEWANDERRNITIQHLLNMRSGLEFVEDYVDDAVSDTIEMLFGKGQHNVADYAINKPLAHPIGEFWSYSSGTTNILCKIASDVLGGPEATHAYLREKLFDPIHMNTAIPKFDDAGTFIGSSFVYATARDFARFGELYRNDGRWGPAAIQVLPSGCGERAKTATPVPANEPYGYGSHWWLWQWPNSFAAHGYEGQRVLIVPDRGLVVVRLGKTPETSNLALREAIEAIVAAIPESR
jgi:CubicO group peptidase (beta-lactamase class C family)